MRKPTLFFIVTLIISVVSTFSQIDPNSRPLHHFYEHQKDAFHLYTTDPSEVKRLKNHSGWSYVGIIGYVLAKSRPGTIPLYRLLKSEFGGTNHMYTVNMDEANAAINNGGWTEEGVVGHIMPTQVPGTAPLLRLYLDCQYPNDKKFYSSCIGAVGGDVNYLTASVAEKNTAIQNGMRFIRVEGYLWTQPVQISPKTTPKIPGGGNTVDPDTDLLNRGCTRTAVGSYACDAVGAYEACESYRKVGKTKSCIYLGSLAEQKAKDKKLFGLGCTRLLGRPDEYICKTPKAFNECEVYRKAGKNKKCVMAK